MFVVPRVGRFPYRKGSKTIRARRATLFQSGSLVSRGKKTVGSRNPLEDQRGARKKCKNKIDAHAQCFHAGEFSAFVRPDLKELFWRRTRFEEEEWSARLPELIIIIKKIRRRRRRREKGGNLEKRSFFRISSYARLEFYEGTKYIYNEYVISCSKSTLRESKDGEKRHTDNRIIILRIRLDENDWSDTTNERCHVEFHVAATQREKERLGARNLRS